MFFQHSICYYYQCIFTKKLNIPICMITIYHICPIIPYTVPLTQVTISSPLDKKKKKKLLLFVDLLMMAVLTGVRWSSRGNFDLYFSLISDIEYFFRCLLAICTSSLEKCLFRSFVHFSIGLLAFLLLSYLSCLYVLEIRPLLVASFQAIFSHSVQMLEGVWRKENPLALLVGM